MKTKQFDESKLLALFYESDNYRVDFQAPFVSDGYVCASEAYRLILIKPEICTGNYNHIKTRHVKKILKPHNIDITLTLDQLKKAIDRIPQVAEIVTISPAIECKDCDGEGFVYWEYVDLARITHQRESECPICHGSGRSTKAVTKATGRMIPSPEGIIGIYENKFRVEHLSKLCEAMDLLELDTVKYVASHNGPNTFILTDEITVLICSCTDKAVDTWVCKKKKVKR